MHEDLKHLSLVTTFEVDDSFDSDKFIKLRVRVQHDGENPNGSAFSVEDMDKAKDSIKNIPILANVLIDEDGNPQFGAHDMHIEADKTNEGQYRLIYDEQPLGLVPETNNYEISEYNGKNYVFTDAFVWRDYCNYAEDIINRDKDIKLSMEILVDAYRYDSKTKIYNITDYRYKGITLLGNDYGTGMIDALATTESFSDEGKQKLFTLMSELKEEIIKNQSSTEVDISKKQSFSKKEEEKILNKEQIDALFTKYNLNPENINFNIEEIGSIEILEEKFKEIAQEQFSLTGSQLMDELSIQLRAEKVRDRWGDEYSRYSFYDYKDLEVYAFDRMDNWKLVGFTYSINGDSISIDFETKKRKKIEIVDFDEGVSEDTNPMFSVIQESFESGKNDGVKEIEEKFSDYEQIKSDFDLYKETYKTAETDVDVLREFQNKVIETERKEAEEVIFSQFDEKLNENEEYQALKSNCKDFNLNDLEDKCFSILGRMNTTFSIKSSEKQVTKVPVDTTAGTNDEPYGGLFNEYGKKQ